MSYSDIEDDSEIELEEEDDEQTKTLTDMVNACKYGWVHSPQ